MNRTTILLAIFGLTACTGTPASPTHSPSPSASASTAATASPSPSPSPTAKGGALHLTFSDTQTAQPNPGAGYDAESIFATAAGNGLSASAYANAGKPDRNVNLTLGTTAPKAGETFPLQNSNPFLPGYLQYSHSDGANVQPKTYLWTATGGMLKIDAVDGATVSFSYVNAVMSPKNDTGNPNNANAAGTFTLNGSGKVDVPAK